MDSLVTREKSEAKKKGVFAAAAGAGYLTWKWFLYRAKHGIRF